MATRQDSGSNSAQQNERPNPNNENAVPETTDETRGHAGKDDAEDDEFDDSEDVVEDEDEDSDDSKEGTF